MVPPVAFLTSRGAPGTVVPIPTLPSTMSPFEGAAPAVSV